MVGVLWWIHASNNVRKNEVSAISIKQIEREKSNEKAAKKKIFFVLLQRIKNGKYSYAQFARLKQHQWFLDVEYKNPFSIQISSIFISFYSFFQRNNKYMIIMRMWTLYFSPCRSSQSKSDLFCMVLWQQNNINKNCSYRRCWIRLEIFMWKMLEENGNN